MHAKENETKGEEEIFMSLLVTLSTLSYIYSLLHSYTLRAFLEHSSIHLDIEASSLGLGERDQLDRSKQESKGICGKLRRKLEK